MVSRNLSLAVCFNFLAGGLLLGEARLAPPVGQDSKKQVIPKLDGPEREAIIKAAIEAATKYVKSEKKKDRPYDIDRALWGETIAKLKPVRVRYDRVNIAIVLLDNDGMEEGLYVSPRISSYMPRLGGGFTFLERLSTQDDKAFGTLYHYKLKEGGK